MTGINHVLTGVTLAVVTQQPVLAPVLSLISHFILDFVPHFGNHPKLVPFNRNFKIYLLFETASMAAIVLLGILLFPELWWLLVVCAGLAFLPDFFWIFERQLKNMPVFKQFYSFHHAIQWYERPWGIFVELIYFMALLIILSQYI